MKVITLWQPWASLMVMGAKRIETRSRNMSHRGNLAIHAAKKKSKEHALLCLTEPFIKFIRDYDSLPFGKIIGQVDVYDTRTTGEIKLGDDQLFKKDFLKHDFSKIEEAFGNYSLGRYGYLTTNAIEWPIQIEATGNQIVPWVFNERVIPKEIKELFYEEN